MVNSSGSSGWFYDGWTYRIQHNIIWSEPSGGLNFFNFSEPWATISGTPINRHAFQPVHNTTILEVNKVVDGALQKYLAYDSDPNGLQIRLYYTNDTEGTWIAYSQNPILSSSAYHYRWPSTAYVDGTFQMFLEDRADHTLERWTSTDGIHFTFRENVKVGGNEWKTPFIWFNPNDNRWYLYSHDATGSTEYVLVRNSTSIENLTSASDSIVLSEAASFGAASVMYYDDIYWLVAEIWQGGKWLIHAYYSSSPSSGFAAVAESPILTNDEACPMLFLGSTQNQAYLFISRSSSTWYQDTRRVYLDTPISPQESVLDGYQIRLMVHSGIGSNAGEDVYLNAHSAPDFSDVRFTWLNSSSGLEYECNYWIENLTSQSALFWLKIPRILSGTNNTIYVYYGKMDVSTTANPYYTFDLFDDFSSNLSSWTLQNYDQTGSASVVDGWARISSQSSGDFWGITDEGSGIFKSVPFSDNYMIETIFRDQSYPTVDAHNRFLMTRANTGNNAAFYVMLFDGDSSHITTSWRDQTGGQTDWAGENTGLTRGSQMTFYARLVKVGPTFYAYASPDGSSWHLVGSRSGNYQGYVGLVDSYHGGYTEFDWVRVRKYVSLEPTHSSWGNEEIYNGNGFVLIDQSFVSDVRADVNSVQKVGFHAKWSNNGSDIAGGSIYVNSTAYVTNATGWISFDITSHVIGNEKWLVTSVNCNGVTSYTQTAPTPSIVWDRIKITDGGLTRNPLMLGESTTVWFKAIYEYDNRIFNSTNGNLYLNETAMQWSTINNRWEYNHTAQTLDTVTFNITKVLDTSYNLTAINNNAGTQTPSILSSPFSIISNSTITELIFNSVTKEISFTASGPSGTTGFTNVTIAKTLITDINTLKIYVDGNETTYTSTSTDYYWLVHFTYSHSTHKVVVRLNSANTDSNILSSPETVITITSIIITIIALATIIRKKHHK
jgi:hypothetical protein